MGKLKDVQCVLEDDFNTGRPDFQGCIVSFTTCLPLWALLYNSMGKLKDVQGVLEDDLNTGRPDLVYIVYV